MVNTVHLYSVQIELHGARTMHPPRLSPASSFILLLAGLCTSTPRWMLW